MGARRSSGAVGEGSGRRCEGVADVGVEGLRMEACGRGAEGRAVAGLEGGSVV